MLLVFLGLVVFLLSLFSLAAQFGRLAQIPKKLPVVVLALSALVFTSRAVAQVTPPDQSSPAAPLPNEPPATAGPEASSSEPGYDRPVSWKLLFHNWLTDQKDIWSFPARLTQDRNWIPTAAVLGTTAGLFFVDKSESGYFRNTTAFHGFNRILNGNATAIGMGTVAASMYAIGRIRKDSKMQRTALLVGEAMADAAMVQTALKDATMRLRPVRYPDSGWFATSSSPTAYIRGNGSFPSGHSIEAFSVATIIARRYGNHRWVPFAAYGLASLVGFSRLTLNVHFLSDVFMGGALGYSISRFTVLRQ
ncbi:MAG: phosphatase PAP2 family protein [Bryobacteraceae bacterium]|jgi:membrane-associated phospholipid phosphatase